MLKFENVVFCDDIRTEHNGKLILIGVYSNDIAVAHFPIQLGITVWVNVLSDTVGDHRVGFSMQGEGGAVYGEVEVLVSVTSRTAPIPIVLPTIPCVFVSDSALRLLAREESGDWTEIGRKAVQRATWPTNQNGPRQRQPAGP